jgi:hypothetical protein
MIRNTTLGLSLFALMTGSALAATPTHKHASKPVTVATAPAAPAGDTAKDAPKADAPKTDAAKPEKKKVKKEKASKGEAPKTEMKSAPAPETK